MNKAQSIWTLAIMLMGLIIFKGSQNYYKDQIKAKDVEISKLQQEIEMLAKGVCE